MFPETFYETTATISFTLLGLWWIALQAKYNEWIADPLRRRMITIITLYFLLPGSMSLLALLAIENRALWRIAFVVFCRRRRLRHRLCSPPMRGRRLEGAGESNVMELAGHALVVLDRRRTVHSRRGGCAGSDDTRRCGIEPLMAAGILVTLLVILGLILAWTYYVEPPATPVAQ